MFSLLDLHFGLWSLYLHVLHMQRILGLFIVITHKSIRSKSVHMESKSWCEAFHMEISFIQMQVLVHLHVNKTNFHMKGLALGLALKRR